MDKTEQQMIERFIEMRKQVERLEEETYKLTRAADDFCYLATLHYPDFIDHVVEVAKQKNDTELIINPSILIHSLLSHRGFSASIRDKDNWGLERKTGENCRHWLERCEKIITKKKIKHKA